MRFAVLLAAFLAGPAIAAPVPLAQDLATTNILAREAAAEPGWGALSTVIKAVGKLKKGKAKPKPPIGIHPPKRLGPEINVGQSIKGTNMATFAPNSPSLKFDVPVKGNLLTGPPSP